MEYIETNKQDSGEENFDWSKLEDLKNQFGEYKNDPEKQRDALSEMYKKIGQMVEDIEKNLYKTWYIAYLRMSLSIGSMAFTHPTTKNLMRT